VILNITNASAYKELKKIDAPRKKYFIKSMYRSKNLHLKKIMLQKEPEKKKKSLLCRNGYTVYYLSLVTGIDATTMEL
jgi:hypothetical protein